MKKRHPMITIVLIAIVLIAILSCACTTTRQSSCADRAFLATLIPSIELTFDSNARPQQGLRTRNAGEQIRHTKTPKKERDAFSIMAHWDLLPWIQEPKEALYMCSLTQGKMP